MTWDAYRKELLAGAGASFVVGVLIYLIDLHKTRWRKEFDPLKAIAGIRYWLDVFEKELGR